MNTTEKFVPHYQVCAQSDIPRGVRFDCPRSLQGQIVEVAFGTFGRYEAGHGDPFRRITDRGEAGGVTFAKWVDKKPR